MKLAKSVLHHTQKFTTLQKPLLQLHQMPILTIAVGVKRADFSIPPNYHTEYVLELNWMGQMLVIYLFRVLPVSN